MMQSAQYLFLFLLSLNTGVAVAQDADIWRELQRGGLVILMRHGAVDNMSRSTSSDADFEGCEGQFNLTELGRAQALLVGEVLRRRKVPIGGVLASPLCRTRDTARIAFGAYRAWSELEQLPDPEGSARAQRIQAISLLIAGHKGTENLVLVTHQPNIDALTLELVDYATMVLVKPDGRGGFVTVGKIPVTSLVAGPEPNK